MWVIQCQAFEAINWKGWAVGSVREEWGVLAALRVVGDDVAAGGGCGCDCISRCFASSIRFALFALLSLFYALRRRQCRGALCGEHPNPSLPTPLDCLPTVINGLGLSRLCRILCWQFSHLTFAYCDNKYHSYQSYQSYHPYHFQMLPTDSRSFYVVINCRYFLSVPLFEWFPHSHARL